MALFLGIAILFSGVVFYLLSRTDTPVFLSFFGFDMVPVLPAAMINGAGWLPTFVHVVAFTLITAAWLPARPLAWAFAAVIWAVVNFAFEVIQMSSLRPVLENDSLVASAVTGFAESGTFDWLDIVAAMAGAVLGFCLCAVIARRGLAAKKLTPIQ